MRQIEVTRAHSDLHRERAPQTQPVRMETGCTPGRSPQTVLTVAAKPRSPVSEETYLPPYPAKQIFPHSTDELQTAARALALRPTTSMRRAAWIKLSVHSWLLRIGGRNILIDGCCGNGKTKPGRPFWTNLNTNYLERIAAAASGRAHGRDRPRDVHAPASRPCRLEHATARRQMGADLPKSALRLLQARLRGLPRDRSGPEGGPGRDGHLSRVRAADRRGGPRRPRHRPTSAR